MVHFSSIAKSLLITLLLTVAAVAGKLKPEQILVIVNDRDSNSVELGRYYCQTRLVPEKNLFSIQIPDEYQNNISRSAYEKLLAQPVRKKLTSPGFAGKIKCMLTTWSIPFSIDPVPPTEGRDEHADYLAELIEREKQIIKEIQQSPIGNSESEIAKHREKLRLLRDAHEQITGKETAAAVDSELSMVLYDQYSLYGSQPNELKRKNFTSDPRLLMVCRLDGPTTAIARSLIDKAILAERQGLQGTAYIDSGHSKKRNHSPTYEEYDKSLADLAVLIKFRTKLNVVHEKTEKLFQPGQCPETALYCGWYSVKKYIDAFDFVPGCVAFHIASFEAQSLRNERSSNWCPAMLADGVTATLGAVEEPYLDSFPKPKDFFLQLLNKKTLVEAFYYTKPYNSWQLVLIGDPLYCPFAGN